MASKSFKEEKDSCFINLVEYEGKTEIQVVKDYNSYVTITPKELIQLAFSAQEAVKSKEFRQILKSLNDE